MSQGFISHVHYVSQARKLLTFLIKAKVVHTSTLRWVTIRRKREREGFFEENERTRVIREREMLCFRSSDAAFFLLCGILSECTIARNYSNSHGKL